MQTSLPSEARRMESVVAAWWRVHVFRLASITTTDIASASGVSRRAQYKCLPIKAHSPLDEFSAMFCLRVDFPNARPCVLPLNFEHLQQAADPVLRQEVRPLPQPCRKLPLHRTDRAISGGQVDDDPDIEARATTFAGLILELVMPAKLAGQAAAMRLRAESVFALFHQHSTEEAA